MQSTSQISFCSSSFVSMYDRCSLLFGVAHLSRFKTGYDKKGDHKLASSLLPAHIHRVGEDLPTDFIRTVRPFRCSSPFLSHWNYGEPIVPKSKEFEQFTYCCTLNAFIFSRIFVGRRVNRFRYRWFVSWLPINNLCSHAASDFWTYKM